MTHAHYKHQAPEGVVVCEGGEVHVLEAGHPRVPVLAPRHLALVQALGVVTCGYQILDIVDIIDIVDCGKWVKIHCIIFVPFLKGGC